jgi:hypothetical protein
MVIISAVSINNTIAIDVSFCLYDPRIPLGENNNEQNKQASGTQEM